MATQIVIVHDKRRKGHVNAPGKTLITVDKSWSLTQLVTALKSACSNGIYRLIILCHGRPGELKLCKEHLSLSTVKQLAALSGCFDGGVMINACSVAKGGGQTFCSELATTLCAYVEASSGDQIQIMVGVHFVKYLHDTTWNGPVLTWDSAGNLANTRAAGRMAEDDRIFAPGWKGTDLPD